MDSVGFVPAPGFLEMENYLRNAEISVEDDYGLIDGMINNGVKENANKSPELSSLFAQAKGITQEPESESVLAKLRAPTPPHNEKHAQNKSVEMEM